ncbi:MAG: hypothetical protein ACE5EQ_09205, partial [Phycisphaerae bacterium]
MQAKTHIPNGTQSTLIVWTLSAAWLAATTSAWAGPGPSFQGLGDLPGGFFDSQAIAISGNGQAVVGVSNSTSGNQAFRWVDGIMTGLGDLP